MNFDRLQRADVASVILAFGLLVAMSVTWYGTVQTDEARRLISEPIGGQAGEVQRGFNERAEEAIKDREKTAWRADGGIDRVIVVVLLAAYALALFSAYWRAAGKRPEPPFTPAALGAIAAGVGGVLVAYRIVQEPGFDAITTVKAGAPIAVLVLGFLSLTLATAYRSEESGRAWSHMDRVEKEAAEQSAEQPAAPTT